MKNIKKLITCIMLSMTFGFNSATIIYAESIADFVGYYEFTNQSSILRGFEIKEDLFSVLINSVSSEKNDEDDPFTKNILDWRNAFVNQQLSGLIEDTTPEEPTIKDKFPYSEIVFSDRAPFPSFQIDTIKPEYIVEDNLLTVKSRDKILYTFKLEDNKLIDDSGNEFYLMDH